MSKQILFVDDEANILQGLRRMLRPLRTDWEMDFVASAPAALAWLDDHPCDVLVTDMRMPGMDGTALLEQVQSTHPQIVRIVLSGQADRDSTLAAVGCAHQYLSKPCDAETLRTTISRALTLREHIGGAAITRLVAAVDHLPSVPSVYLDLKRELESDDGSAAKAAEIIAGDPAMTAKVLQVVNSAFFGARREITNPLDAVRLLGFDMVQALALTAGVFGQATEPRTAALAEHLWQHSFNTAAYARVIAGHEKVSPAIVDMVVTTALLHDVGKLVMASCIGTDYLQLVRTVPDAPQPLWHRETEAYDTSHAEVGGYLLSLWGLPDRIAEVVAFHHQPAAVGEPGVTPLAIVHAANSLAHRIHGRADEAPLETAYLTECGCAAEVDDWEAACREASSGAAA